MFVQLVGTLDRSVTVGLSFERTSSIGEFTLVKFTDRFSAKTKWS